MPRRYFLTPVEGDGTADNPYRVGALKRGGTYTAGAVVCPTGPDGRPLNNFALVLLDAPDQTTRTNDNANAALPAIGIDVVLSAQQRTQAQAAATKFGIGITVETGDTLRSLITKVANWMGERHFDANNLSVNGQVGST